MEYMIDLNELRIHDNANDQLLFAIAERLGHIASLMQRRYDDEQVVLERQERLEDIKSRRQNPYA